MLTSKVLDFNQCDLKRAEFEYKEERIEEKNSSHNAIAYQPLMQRKYFYTKRMRDVISSLFSLGIQHAFTACKTLGTGINLCKRGRFFQPNTKLSDDLYNQGIVGCQRIYIYGDKGILKAKTGKTPVYLLENVSIVLKRSGIEFVQKRLAKIECVRSILDEQSSFHLIIPKAKIYGDFLIEERLPIHEDSYENMGVYLSHLQQFDQPVGELTRLFSKICIFDLVGFAPGPLGSIEGVKDDVRYDNLPLYIVEKDGKKEGRIGLIDLEWLGKPTPKGLEALARIFPFHLKVIKEEAIKLNMAFDDSLLEVTAERGRKFLRVGYSDHLKWLRGKRVSVNALPSLFDIDSQDKQDFTNLIEKELLKLNKGVNDLFLRKGWREMPPKNFFLQNPQKIVETLAPQISALIIKNMQDASSIQQDKQAQRLLSSDQPLTEGELVSLRSLTIKSSQLFAGVDTLLSQESVATGKLILSIQSQKLAEQLCYCIMQDLVKKEKLFAFYTNGDERSWSWIRH